MVSAERLRQVIFASRVVLDSKFCRITDAPTMADADIIAQEIATRLDNEGFLCD